MLRVLMAFSMCITLNSCGVSVNMPATTNGTDLWELVWADEFDGDGLDSAVWTPELGTGADRGLNGWGNDELQYYTGRSENISVEDGILKIVALKENYEGSGYTSARLITQDKVSVQYGRIEARVRMPAGQGLWPAFWLLGNSIATETWPACGELDVMEFRGQEPSLVAGTVHGPGYSAGSALSGTFYSEGESFSDAFHVVGMDWDSEMISFWVDGEKYHTVRRSQLRADQPWVFDQPFFLLLNLAVGGNYVGDPDEATSFPAAFEVDYVRIYRRN